MSEPENFLTRWSRRKTTATEEDAAPAETPSVYGVASGLRSRP